MLAFLGGSRKGKYYLHFHLIKFMYHWCFVYDNVNCASYLTIYLAELTNLAKKILKFSISIAFFWDCRRGYCKPSWLLRKTNNTGLANSLQESVQVDKKIPENFGVVTDGTERTQNF